MTNILFIKRFKSSIRKSIENLLVRYRRKLLFFLVRLIYILCINIQVIGFLLSKTIICLKLGMLLLLRLKRLTINLYHITFLTLWYFLFLLLIIITLVITHSIYLILVRKFYIRRCYYVRINRLYIIKYITFLLLLLLLLL